MIKIISLFVYKNSRVSIFVAIGLYSLLLSNTVLLAYLCPGDYCSHIVIR